MAWGAENRGQIATEKVYLPKAPLQAKPTMDRLVSQQDGQSDDPCDRRGQRDRCRYPPLPDQWNEPDDPQPHKHRHEQEQVSVQQSLEQVRQTKQNEPPDAFISHVAVEREQNDREPVPRQHLQLRQMVDAIRGEAVE